MTINQNPHIDTNSTSSNTNFSHCIPNSFPQQPSNVSTTTTSSSNITEYMSNSTTITQNFKTKKGLSYVIGDTYNNENHILPINQILYSNFNQQLYTASRDGTIKIWEDDVKPNHESPPQLSQDCTDLDEKLLRLETSISSNPFPFTNIHNSSFQITNTHDLHFDWINDMSLINQDRNLVSCSSDLSIKILDLYNTSSVVHKLPNVHTDYIKKLSYKNKNGSNLVSGGLDGKIIDWDLNQLTPIQIIDNVATESLPNSIYSLSTNSNGNLISTGGPSNIINVFDKRCSNNVSSLVRKLIGHQDNLRCLEMNDRYILSGSSDTSIKLWDLRNFKVYKNFDLHNYPIWSLIANSQSDYQFDEFYSGDRHGYIVKTDLSNLTINQQEEKFFSGHFSCLESTLIDEKLGISTIIAKSNSPILSLCKQDGYVWCSNYESLNKYVCPITSQLSTYQYLRNCLDYSNNKELISNNQIDILLNESVMSPTDPGSDLNSEFYDLISHLSIDGKSMSHDLHSTFSNQIDSKLINNNIDAIEDKNEYVSMILNVNGGPSMEFINTYKEEIKLNQHKYLDLTPLEILLNPISKDQIISVPFNISPIDKFDLSPKSVVSKRVFNNKRQIMLLYLNGDIKIWDILICKELKYFPFNGVKNNILDSKQIEQRIKQMDEIFQNYQTSDTLNNWCDVEIKAGKLLVSIRETSFMNIEVYYDDLIKNYPFLAIEYNKEQLGKYQINVNQDDRFYLGLILLNSLFHGYTLYENIFDQSLRDEIFKLNKPETDTNVSNGFTNGVRRLKAFSRKSSKNNVNTINSQQSSPIHSTNTSTIDFSIDSSPNSINEFLSFTDEQLGKTSENYDDSIMKLLQTGKKIYMDRNSNGSKAITDSILNIDLINPCLNPKLSKDIELKYHPIIPFNQFPNNMSIHIFEYSPNLGNHRDLSSFKLTDIEQLKSTNKTNLSSNQLVDQLRKILPRWIGQPILFDKYTIKENPKITFQLIEVDYFHLDPNKKIGGKSQRKIKKLPMLESSIKLTSHNMLRVSKILYYLTDKFESSTKEMKDKKMKPTDWLVIECKGKELSHDLTLQTIKTKIWKSSSDIELRFRRKFD